MSTNCQPSSHSTVHRKQQDGSSLELPCPESVILYNKFMGGVDRGDQLCGYYHCRSRSRKFYKYIFFFLLDVAITNTYILMKSSGRPCPFKDFKSFRLQLAKELVGEYCSHRRRGAVIHPSPFIISPSGWTAMVNHDVHGDLVLSTVTPMMTEYSQPGTVLSVEWFCHSGDPSDDCFLKWHTRLHVWLVHEPCKLLIIIYHLYCSLSTFEYESWAKCSSQPCLSSAT